MRRIRVAAVAPDRLQIREAAALLRSGGIAAIPTDTLYGLAANPFEGQAVARLFTIKQRGLERALPLIAADVAQVDAALGPLGDLARRLAAAFWPGPLTLVLPARVELAREVTGGLGTVGVRVPAHDVARALCAEAGVPLTATSANISGEPPTDDPDTVARQLADRLDLLIDAGHTPGGPPSTIVDATGTELRLIRAGAVAWDAVLAASTRA
jgi:L-threonylcarbamoyladenylate synthase